KLAAALLADRNRVAEPSRHEAIPCFVCGYSFIYKGRQVELNGRFCSMRCQDWYDAGNEPIGEQVVYRWRDGKPMKKGARGFYIDCVHCQKVRKLGATLLFGRMRARLSRAAGQSCGHGRSRHGGKTKAGLRGLRGSHPDLAQWPEGLKCDPVLLVQMSAKR